MRGWRTHSAVRTGAPSETGKCRRSVVASYPATSRRRQPSYASFTTDRAVRLNHAWRGRLPTRRRSHELRSGTGAFVADLSHRTDCGVHCPILARPFESRQGENRIVSDDHSGAKGIELIGPIDRSNPESPNDPGTGGLIFRPRLKPRAFHHTLHALRRHE